jgi:hypothetical protein
MEQMRARVIKRKTARRCAPAAAENTREKI